MFPHEAVAGRRKQLELAAPGMHDAPSRPGGAQIVVAHVLGLKDLSERRGGGIKVTDGYLYTVDLLQHGRLLQHVQAVIVGRGVFVCNIAHHLE